MDKETVTPNLLYGCEAWLLNAQENQRVEAVEIIILCSICEFRRSDEE